MRPATQADIEAFSSLPGKPSLRALCMELDGRIIALGGLAWSKGRWFAFADLPQEARRYKMHILKAAKRLLAEARRDGIRFIYAEMDHNERRAAAWLKSLGFHIDPRSGTLYRWRACDG